VGCNFPAFARPSRRGIRFVTEYDEHPEHPLSGLPQEVLDVARHVLDDPIIAKCIESGMAHPLADAVVAALRQAGYIRQPGGGT
jgi:hypothetical protein